MKISPRYGSDPLVRMAGDPAAVGVPMVRQRHRMAKLFASMTAEQWMTPSRCEGWRVQDVVAHLIGTDRFWNAVITQGVAGNPTRILTGFDPKATPSLMVESVRDASSADTLAQLVDGCEALCATVESLDADGWNAIGESPAGHVTLTAVAHHALWDAWIHERDILEPLGMTQDEEPDEIVACLRYASALNPALALQSSPQRSGAVVIDARRPATRVVVTVDGHVQVDPPTVPDRALALSGDAIDLIEALSVRKPWKQAIPADDQWLVSGLQDVFETTAPR